MTSAVADSEGMVSRVRAVLPKGQTLPEADWRKRHHAMVGVLFAESVGLTIFGLAQGYGVLHAFGHVALLAPLGIFALVVQSHRRLAAVVVSVGMITASAALVHVWNGVIEAHFLFFVTIVLLALYEDWLPFLVAAAYVVLHHGLAGAIDSTAVYNHPDAQDHPWKWAGIHGGFIVAAGAAAVANWRLNEDVRAESAHQATHDQLTGLPNRRAMLADLAESVPEATSERPIVLTIFDLNGFKNYNDTFGHPAGDSLLVRVAGRLRDAMSGKAGAYRMGGDEFCTVVWPGRADQKRVPELAAEALNERGEEFVVTASYGSVTVPDEARTIEEAMRLADQRMYARKGLDSRASAGRQSADVLLKILSERSPSLGIHLDQVTSLADAVAQRMELPEEEVAPLLQGASLHDTGKAAIPDEILNKPGSLDDDELAYIRRHTLIGERILSVAPALRKAAKLVRSSHERYDGQGYPDGLAGDQIPLGSQIIAVCDAYDAMVSDRPYRPDVKTAAEAVSELRRCAGAQFDPHVVDVLCEEIESSNLQATASR